MAIIKLRCIRSVDKVKTEYGFQLENKNVNVDSFDGYDLVLLGDIHVPNQSLNDEGTIKYCGYDYEL